MKTNYFTLGQDHAHRCANITLDKDIVVKITSEDPRSDMFRMFGAKWAFQYDTLEEVGMEYYSRGIYDINKGEIVNE